MPDEILIGIPVTISGDITPDPSVSINEPVPDPEVITSPEQPEAGSTVSENEPEETIDDIPQTVSQEKADAQIIKENYTYNSITETVEVSHNMVIDPDDLVSVNSVSLNVISADGLSLNSVSVNVSNNYISNNTLQILSINEAPFWDKPFKEYTVSEGMLFIIMISLVLGFVSSHLLKGLRSYGNI